MIIALSVSNRQNQDCECSKPWIYTESRTFTNELPYSTETVRYKFRNSRDVIRTDLSGYDVVREYDVAILSCESIECQN